MINGTPESHAFTLSMEVGGKWAWVEHINSISERLNAPIDSSMHRTPEQLIEVMIEKTNNILKDDDDDGLPDHFTGALKFYF